MRFYPWGRGGTQNTQCRVQGGFEWPKQAQGGEGEQLIYVPISESGLV